MDATRQLTSLSDPEAEAAFIGSCFQLGNSDTGRDVLRVVTEDCFTQDLWRDAWELIRAEWMDGREADPVVLSRRIPGDRLAELLRPESAYPCWEGYALPRAKYLRGLAQRRAMVELGHTVQTGATGNDPDGVLAYALATAELLDAQADDEDTGDLTDVAWQVEREMDEGRAAGHPTGIGCYDGWTGGLRRGTVHVIAAPTGVGKTLWLCQILHRLIDDGLRCAFFSLEMPRKELWRRLMFGRIGLLANRLKGQGAMWKADELAQYQRERDKMLAAFKSGQLVVHCGPRSAAQIAGVVRQQQSRAFFVDYIQLMAKPPGIDRYYDAVTENATALQHLAMRAEATCLFATQLSLQGVREGPGGAVAGEGSGRTGHVANVFARMAPEDGGKVRLHLLKHRDGPAGQESVLQLVHGRWS